MTPQDLPRYGDLMLPTLLAVAALGGSGSAKTIEMLGPSEEMLAVTYPSREKAVYVDRLEWARSYCKLGGALESPKRGLFLLTPEGKEIVALSEAEARDRLARIDAEVRSRRRAAGAADDAIAADTGTGDAPVEEDDKTVQGPGWKEQLLARLHRLSPEGFEEFALVLLRAYGLQLQRTGGTGDQGIDGIGTAPLSAVLSATVAVQAKRWDPSRTVSREVVALFQRDASAAGAERAVMVTLARYSEPARRAATSATPTVDLIDGDRLCELARDAELGVRPVPTVDESWFDRFGNE
jgi:restriction system protein